jgi:hypothetical protein
MSAGKVAGSIGWVIMTLLSVGVGGYALYHVAMGFAHVPPPIMANPNFQPIGIETHIAASGVAMLVGAFQFNRGLRSRLPTLHRWTGRLYVAACIVGGIAGGAIALGSTSGLIAGWGFLSLAALWIPFTALAWLAAMRKDFVAHERWMIRSFALTFGAVTLRLQLPIAGVLGDAGLIPNDFVSSYQVIAWLAWVPNLLVAELIIASKRKPRRPKVASAPTPA